VDRAVAIGSSKLYLYESDPANRPGFLGAREIGASGWASLTLTAPGDANGDGRPDLLARDTTTGKLYLYRGQANGSFSNRTEYGAAGWTLTNRPLLAGGNNVSDLWATAGDGTLKFYAGTSAANPTDGPQTQVGVGWGVIKAIA
jgi:VCBS repeat protein